MHLIKSNNNFRFLLFQSPYLKMEILTGSTWSLFRIGIGAPRSRSVAIDDDAPVLSFGGILLSSLFCKYSQESIAEIVVLDTVRNSTNFFRVKLRFGNMFSIACKKKTTIYSSMS